MKQQFCKWTTLKSSSGHAHRPKPTLTAITSRINPQTTQQFQLYNFIHNQPLTDLYHHMKWIPSRGTVQCPSCPKSRPGTLAVTTIKTEWLPSLGWFGSGPALDGPSWSGSGLDLALGRRGTSHHQPLDESQASRALRGWRARSGRQKLKVQMFMHVGLEPWTSRVRS